MIKENDNMKSVEKYFQIFSALFAISKFVCHFCTFIYYTFQRQLHERLKMTLYTSFVRNSNVPHRSAAYVITRKRSERTFHSLLVHALVFLFHSQQKSLHSVYNRGRLMKQTDYASLALNAHYRLVVSSPFTKDISYTLVIIRICKLWRVAA